MTSSTHGARLADDVIYEALPRYSSSDGDDYFGWGNMKPKTPLILAKRFIVEFPNLAEQGKQPDPAYVSWFRRMLMQTAPHGVIHAFEDGVSPEDRLLTSFCDEGVVVRMPPARAGR